MQQRQQRTEAAGKGKNATGGSASSPSIPTVMGLNDNLDFMGRLIHVQTENMRSPAMCIVTQVFCNGRVVFSTKSEFPPGLCESQAFSQIQGLMRAQHFEVIKKIRDKKTQILSPS
jgi:hypothetical protein